MYVCVLGPLIVKIIALLLLFFFFFPFCFFPAHSVSYHLRVVLHSRTESILAVHASWASALWLDTLASSRLPLHLSLLHLSWLSASER